MMIYYMSRCTLNSACSFSHIYTDSCHYPQLHIVPVSSDSNIPPLLSNMPCAVATTGCASSESADPALLHTSMQPCVIGLHSHYFCLFLQQLLRTDSVGGVVALSVEYRTCDREVVASSLGRARGVETLGKFLTPVCLCSPSSTSWYRPKGGDALRLGSKGRYGCVWVAGTRSLAIAKRACDCCIILKSGSYTKAI